MALLMQQGFARIELIQGEKPMTVREELEYFEVAAWTVVLAEARLSAEIAKMG